MRLRQLPNGRWYKFGAGKPTEATDDEVSLWLNAQVESTERPKKPQTTWGRMIGLAKWAAFFAAAITFSTLYVEWHFLSGLYSSLGAEELVFTEFARNPIHITGVRVLVSVLFTLGLATLLAWFTFHALVDHLLGLVNDLLNKWSKAQLIDLITMPLSMVIAFASFPLGSRGLSGSGEDALLFYSAAVALTVVAWLCARYWVLYSLRTRRFLEFLTLLIMVFIVFTGLLSNLPRVRGQEAGLDILSGNELAPELGINAQAVMIAVKKRSFVSERVNVSQWADNSWVYWPQYLDFPGTDSTIPTLQYLGADENTVYLLDIGVASVLAIPRDDVLQMIFLRTAFRAQVLPDGVIRLRPEPTATTTPAQP